MKTAFLAITRNFAKEKEMRGKSYDYIGEKHGIKKIIPRTILIFSVLTLI